MKDRLLILPLHVELDGLESGEGVSLAGAHVQVHLRLARQAVLRAPLDADLGHVSGSRARAAHLDRTLPEKRRSFFTRGWTKRWFLGSVNPAVTRGESTQPMATSSPANQYSRE